MEDEHKNNPAADVQATEHNETGATGESDAEVREDNDAAEVDEERTLTEAEVAKYRILAENVDTYDEQMNITGTLKVDSIQTLPVEVGTKLVAEGKAEAVGADAVE